MQQPFDNPEVIKLFGILLDNLFEESGRGALLIATSHVDEHLTELIEAVLPEGLSKDQRKSLFKYPGTLSTLSSKIETTYAFRLIDKELYDNLNALRKLRNDAAHSSAKFELTDLNEKLQKIYNMGSGFRTLIRECSVKLLVEGKIALLMKGLESHNLSAEEKEIIIKSLLDENTHILEKQLPFWELTIGLCLLCWLIIRKKNAVLELTKSMRTWEDLLRENRIAN